MVRKIQVLLLDEPEIFAGVQAAFADTRFELHCFNDPQAAWEALSAARFEVVVANLRAVTSDGQSLMHQIVEELPRVRCVAVVQVPDIASVQEAMKLGCRSYLAKPASPEAILKAVEDVAASIGQLTLTIRELQLRLAQMLRTQRLRKELTLTQMALRIGLSKAQLSQIELGKSWPSFPTLKHIAEELNQPFSDLFRAIERD